MDRPIGCSGYGACVPATPPARLPPIRRPRTQRSWRSDPPRGRRRRPEAYPAAPPTRPPPQQRQCLRVTRRGSPPPRRPAGRGFRWRPPHTAVPGPSCTQQVDEPTRVVILERGECRDPGLIETLQLEAPSPSPDPAVSRSGPLGLPQARARSRAGRLPIPAARPASRPDRTGSRTPMP